MKNLFRFFVVFVAIVCSITVAYAENTIVFNKKVFELQYSKCDKTSCVNKYIPESQNLKRWKEMITITTLSQGEVKKYFWRTKVRVSANEKQALISYSPKINSLSFAEYSGQVADTDVIYTYLIVKNGDDVKYDFEVEDEDSDDLAGENGEVVDSAEETFDDSMNDNEKVADSEGEEDEEVEEELFEPQEVIPAARICVYTYTRKYSAWGDDVQSIAETLEECKDNDRRYHRLMFSTEFPAVITDYYEKEIPQRLKKRRF